MIKKIKSFVSKIGRRGKALICGAVALASSCAMAAVASAASNDTSDTVSMKSMLSDAGTTLISSFNDLVQTMIPIIMGIIGGGLVIFGLMAMFKLAKSIFRKVTG